MTPSFALAAFAVGVLGSAHCAAMCGGFAATATAPAHSVALHGGRIGSYMLGGSLAGALGAAPAAILASSQAHFVALALACSVLFFSGLRLAGIAHWPAGGFGVAERLGRMAARTARRIGSPRAAPQRFLLGALWGWAPCALVYSALPLALASGSAASGAVVMGAFGLGTLPALLGAAWLIARLGDRARRWAGVLLMALAVVAAVALAGGDRPYCG